MHKLLQGLIRGPFTRRQTFKSKPVFGLRCDPMASQQLRSLADEVDVQIGCLGEHSLGVSVAYIRWQFGKDERTRARAIKVLRDHVIKKHMLVDRLDHLEDLKPFAAYEEPRPGDELLKAAYTLVKGLEESGLPHQLLLDTLRDLIVRRAENRTERERRTALAREVDLRYLQGVHERAPELIHNVVRLVNFYGRDEINRVLGLDEETENEEGDDDGEEWREEEDGEEDWDDEETDDDN